MSKIKFSEKIILKDKIYFLKESTNQLFFFEEDSYGYYIIDEKNRGEFEWHIEDGYLTINGNNISEIWEIKRVNKKDETLIIRISNTDGDTKDDILSWAFDDDPKESESEYTSFLYIFKNLNKKNKILLSLAFLFLFLFLFFLLSNLFLLKEMHFLLKIVFISITMFLIRDKFLLITLNLLNKKER